MFVLMCASCWQQEYKEARIDTPAVRGAARLMDVVYQYNAVGGGLHVVLDDWNIEDEYLDDRFAYPDASPDQVAAEEACLTALRALSLDERASALALHRKFWN